MVIGVYEIVVRRQDSGENYGSWFHAKVHSKQFTVHGHCRMICRCQPNLTPALSERREMTKLKTFSLLSSVFYILSSSIELLTPVSYLLTPGTQYPEPRTRYPILLAEGFSLRAPD